MLMSNVKEEEFRLRIIANSDSVLDQSIKTSLKKELLEVLSNVEDNKIEYINNNSQLIENIVKSNIKDTDYEFTIAYGINHFPTKSINGNVMPSGDYNSLVITLGEGYGENYWCILYPDSVTNGGNVVYKSYLYEKFKDIFL